MKRRGTALIIALVMLSLSLTIAMAAGFTVGVPVSYTDSTSVTIDQSGWYYVESWGGNGISSPLISGSQSQPIFGYFYLEAGETIYVQVSAAGSDGGGAASGVYKGGMDASNIIITSGGGASGNSYSLGQPTAPSGLKAPAQNSRTNGANGQIYITLLAYNDSYLPNTVTEPTPPSDNELSAALDAITPGCSYVKLNGSYSFIGPCDNYTITSVGFEYKLPSSGIWIEVPTTGTSTPFSADLLGLEPETTYDVRAFASYTDGSTQTEYICASQFTTLDTPTTPTVETLPITDISKTSATFHALYVMGDQGDEYDGGGFEYRVYNNTIPSGWIDAEGMIVDNFENKSFSLDMTGLAEGTEYEVRAYIIADHDSVSTEYYGEPVRFTTTATNLLPAITSKACLVTGTTAGFSGTYTDGDVNNLVTDGGFEYRLSGSDGPYKAVPSSAGSGALSGSATIMAPGTYEYRAYINYGSGGVLYSDIDTFTIAAYNVPVPVVSVPSHTHNTADLQGSYTIPGAGNNPTIASVGFRYKLNTDSDWSSYVVSGTTSPFTHTISGLSPNTDYDVQSFVTYSDGTQAQTVYSPTTTFKTDAIPLIPTVSTGDATNLTLDDVTLNGSYTLGQGASAGTFVSKAFEVRLYVDGMGAEDGWIALDPSTTPGSPFTHSMTFDPADAGKQWQVRALLTYYDGTQNQTIVGNNKEFIQPKAVTIVTLYATNITQTSARLNASYTAGIGDAYAVSGVRFYLRKVGETSWGDALIVTDMNSISPNGFSLDVSGLSASTQYEFYAELLYGNSNTSLQGEVLNFTTKTKPAGDGDGYYVMPPVLPIIKLPPKTGDVSGMYGAMLLAASILLVVCSKRPKYTK